MAILAAGGVAGMAIRAVYKECVAAMRANPRASKILCSAMGTGFGRLIHLIYVYERLQPCIASCFDILDIGCGRAAIQ
jgi:hypothetical protein